MITLTVAFIVPASAADDPTLKFVEIDDMLIPSGFLESKGMQEFPNAPLISPSDSPACAQHKSQFDTQIAGGAETVRQESHTSDGSFTLGQTVIKPTGAGQPKLYFKTISQPKFPECIEALNGEDDDNPGFAFDIDVTKIKLRI
ncbi:MAG: hypothetical protein FJW86_04025 [Actinobacteria bacterium]|nr:hypothetical protein [Actinomycetota bacterium]